MFLSDLSKTHANFSTPLPFLRPALKTGKLSEGIKKLGENKIGKIFLKNAQDVTRVLPNGEIKRGFGIADSGKTLRKTPFAIAGGLGVAYGGYRAKKTYDKYKPEIQMGRTVLKKYNQFKNMFNKEDN